MSKVGRNEPCPCGSGQKYKKCCLPEETTQRLYNNAKQKVIRKAINFSKKFKRETRDLKKDYRKLMSYGRNRELAQGEAANLTNIMLFDNVVKEDKTLIQLFADRSENGLRRREKKVLNELVDLNLGVYEVKEVAETTYHLEDLLKDKELKVAKTEVLVDMANEDDIIFTRVAKINNEYQIVGTLGKVVNDFKEQIINIVNYLLAAYEKENNSSKLEDFLQDYSLFISLIPSKIQQLKLRQNNDNNYDQQIIELLQDYLGIDVETDSVTDEVEENADLHNSLVEIKEELNLQTDNLEPTDETEEVIAKTMADKFNHVEVNIGLSLWRKFNQVADSVRGNAESWGAGVEYLINRLADNNLTQGDVGNRYDVSSSTVARKYKTISKELQIEL
ncbi:SEC-C metal-binding domain-containing protein [Halanaerocella petrolearia]